MVFKIVVWFVCDVLDDNKTPVGAPTHVRKSVSVDTSTSDISIPNIAGSISCSKISTAFLICS